nr:hypothetical protein [Tanacetum cinerariifolium]
MDLFNLISAPNPTKVKISLRPCVAHEVPLLTATASRVVDMEDPDAATESSGTPSTIEKSPLDFDNENPSKPSQPVLRPPAIAGRRWVIGHGLRLAVMKCGESLELRHAFTNVVSVGLVKAMSEGLAHGPPRAERSEAPNSGSARGLKDAPIEVRDPRNPWVVKGEMLLEDAIAANVSRAKKKKKCRVVCHTHGINTAHHVRSDGAPVSVPTISPQGLVILLADAAIQIGISKDDASPRLLRSKSLPPMYNLDWS